MSVNKVFLMGRLTRDPELRQTQSGTSVCRFSVAVDRYSKDDEKKADFIDVTAWRQTAEFVCKWFGKGKMIFIEGNIQNNNYTDKNGNKVYSYVVTADKVDFCGDRQQDNTDYRQPTNSGYQQNNTGGNQAGGGGGFLDDFAPIGDGEAPF